MMHKFLIVLMSPVVAFAEEGHSHGSGGEVEHLFPIIGILLTFMVIGGVYYFKNNKKQD